MGFNCGVVGLPNVGKSTLFNALTNVGVETANYPFCTIEPNRGMTPVPDRRLQRLARVSAPEKVTPTTLEFLDIAGLVEGAHKGEGLGNQFLSHIRSVDAVAHVVRDFIDMNVSHVYADVNPLRDVEVVNTELALSDLEQVERRLEKSQKMARVGDKEVRAEIPVLERFRDALSVGKAVRELDLDEPAVALCRQLALLTAKPTMFIVNVDEEGLQQDRPGIVALRELAEQQGAEVLKICAALEAEILQLDDPEEQQVFWEELGLTESGLFQIIRAGYRLLDLITFYTTVGPELRAWTIPRKTQATQAAGRIHTDFEKGFIRGEVIHWDDFDQLGDEQKVKEAGLMHLEGRGYEVQDGDIIRFRFNV